MKSYLSKGFTLVELLIVIALLGIIATIVIAAINPIEQANRATDSGQKADASQLVSAVQRYYASHSQFPWQVTNAASYPDSTTAYTFSSAALTDAGVCGATCAASGELITSNELQSAFLNKTFVTTTVQASKLFIGKAAGSASGVFVCWVPKSSTNRQNLIGRKLVMNLQSGFTAAGVPTTTSSCDTGPNAAGWTVSGGALPTCAECVPE